jgi:hypothetical protein
VAITADLLFARATPRIARKPHEEQACQEREQGVVGKIERRFASR